MKNSYNKTKWVDNKTPVCAQYLNKIEDAIGEIYEKGLGYDELVQGDGITVGDDINGKAISVDTSVVRSSSVNGIEWLYGEPETPEIKKLYFILDPDTNKLSKILLGSVIIFQLN